VVTRPVKLLHQRDQEDSTHDLLFRALQRAGLTEDEWSDFVYDAEAMPGELMSNTKFNLAGYRQYRKRDAEFWTATEDPEAPSPPYSIEDFWTRNRIDTFTRALEVACASSDFGGYIHQHDWDESVATEPRGAEVMLCDPRKHLKLVEVTPL